MTSVKNATVLADPTIEYLFGVLRVQDDAKAKNLVCRLLMHLGLAYGDSCRNGYGPAKGRLNLIAISTDDLDRLLLLCDDDYDPDELGEEKGKES